MRAPLRLALLAAATLVAFACASSSRPWIEAGVELGTISAVETADGERWEYRDRAGRVSRVEHRTDDGELAPGRTIEHREHDRNGRVTLVRHTTPAGRPAIGPEGFCVRRTRHETSPDGERLVHHEHFDEADRPLVLPAGYHRETYTFSGSRLLRRSFFAADGAPVGVTLGEQTGVRELRYVHLRAATPVVMEMFVGADGEPIHKRQIAGATELRVDYVTVYPEYASPVYPYTGRYVTYSSD